jgi:glycosyltransferase involved in cell wall biosynthesis
VPFGFSVHALDARKVEPAELHERAAAAHCVVACNPDVARSLRDVGVEPTLTPHGVDRVRFHAIPGSTEAPDAPELLAVGRLVDKKGFEVLVDAVAAMQTPWRLRIVGDGPNRARLEAAIDRLGLGGRVALHGRVTHDELPALLRGCRAVVVPSVTDAAGDRDGLPNVVLEAMAAGRAVVASDVAAIAEAVHHERTGLLVTPGDAAGLAAALDRVAGDAPLRMRLGAAAQDHVSAHYDLADCSERFCRLLEQAYG